MDALFILLVAAIVICLISIPVVALYSYLEAINKKNEMTQLARKLIIKQIEQEKEVEMKVKRSMENF